MDEERRRAPRYRLLADAEIVALKTSTKLQARTSDVSLVGCFMNASSSFPQGTEITLKLSTRDATFSSRGIVERTLPMGMGVSFRDVKADQQKVLRGLLDEINRGNSPS